jgi:cell division transport system permease protein
MRLRLLFSEAWRSLGANLSTTFAATMTVLVGMFLFGLFIALGSWSLSFSNHAKSEIHVKLYFDGPLDAAGPASRNEEKAIARRLAADPLVKNAKFISAAQGLLIMKKREPTMASALEINPLPDSFDITPKKGEDASAIVKSFNPLPAGVEKVDGGKQISKDVLVFAHSIEYVVTAATLILLVASTLLISNTIRLSIFSRRREIEVMKLVGATNWFVRGPFMIEGLLCGILGSALAVILLIIGKEVALPSITHQWLSVPGVHALSFTLTAVILLAVGLGVGALGSGLTVRKFLQV